LKQLVAKYQQALYPFGSFEGGPFDTVNLGSLNVHFSIPIIHKAGVGMQFAYDLRYDSSVWAGGASSGTAQWTPVANFLGDIGSGGTILGWRADSALVTGFVAFARTSTSCTDSFGGVGVILHYSNFVFITQFGSQIAFGGTAQDDQFTGVITPLTA